jgi:hypothetical protein
MSEAQTTHMVTRNACKILGKNFKGRDNLEALCVVNTRTALPETKLQDVDWIYLVLHQKWKLLG